MRITDIHRCPCRLIELSLKFEVLSLRFYSVLELLSVEKVILIRYLNLNT